MLVLISKTFKAKFQGELVAGHCKEKRGEFILDTNDEKQFEFAVLNEIAQANGIKIKKGKKKDVLQTLEAGLLNLNLKEINTMSDTDKVKEIVEAGIKAGKSDEEMVIEIIQTGIAFGAAGRMFKKAVQEGGYRLTNKEREENVMNHLANAEFEPTDYDQVKAMAEELEKSIKDTDSVRAMRLIKKYCKVNEIEFPKKPKKPKGGFLAMFKQFVISNPAVSVEELHSWIEENTKTEERADSFKKKYTPWLEFAQSVAGIDQSAE